MNEIELMETQGNKEVWGATFREEVIIRVIQDFFKTVAVGLEMDHGK